MTKLHLIPHMQPKNTVSLLNVLPLLPMQTAMDRVQLKTNVEDLLTAPFAPLLDGTVFRSPIVVKGITPFIPTWTKPITIARHAYGDVYKNTEMVVEATGKAELVVHNSRRYEETSELIHEF